MNLQRIVVALAVAMALGVLAFLLRMTQAQDIDVDLHNARLERLRTVSQLDADFSAAAGRARLQLDGKGPDLAGLREQLDVGHLALAEGKAGLDELGAAVRETLKSYRAAHREKLILARDHEEGLGWFVADFQALREVSGALLADTALPGALRQSIAALMREALTYAIQSASDNAPRLEQLTLRIKSAADADRSPARRENLNDLARLIGEVQSGKDAVQRLTDQLIAASTGKALGALTQAYEDDFRRRQTRANRYRLILAVYVAALLLAFGGLGLRLRHSFGALDHANAALRDANANLEKLVEQRTVALRKALDDLRLQQAQLVQSEKMASLGQMVAGVAHEINTPLGYARSNVGIVRESVERLAGLDGETRAETLALLGDAEHGLGQISELVLGLKDFSRVDRSKTELFDVNEGLETALKICHNRLKGRVEVVREFGQLPPIPCAPSQLNQVFLNILTNAGQAIAGEGTIRIRTRETGDAVEIAIRDSGSGMDAETQKHIFEPFFTTKDVGQGTGLGLSIVFGIVRDHHGRITVNSAPGQGAEFVLSFPKRRPAAAAPAPAAAAPTIVLPDLTDPLPA